MLGADAVWMGTRFIATAESGVSDAYRARVVAATADQTILTDTFDLALGRPWPDGVSGRAGREPVLGALARTRGRAPRVDATTQRARVRRDARPSPTSRSRRCGRARRCRSCTAVEPAGAVVARLVEEATRVLTERPGVVVRRRRSVTGTPRPSRRFRRMTDWATISSLATAGGTLVLAVATFSAVRSSNRSARLAERSLLAGMRPVLVGSRLDDPVEKVPFVEQRWFRVAGGHGVAQYEDGVVYLMMGVRNVGTGLGVLRGWQVRPGRRADRGRPTTSPVEEFRPQLRDIYVPAGDSTFWHGALRDPDDPLRAEVVGLIDRHETVTIELLYGDGEGGQRVDQPLRAAPVGDDDWLISVSRHWNLDRDDPR